MARIRSCKPEFWLDRKLARSCSRDARLLYIGLWNYADEHARLHGDPAVIKGQVFPYDDLDVVPLIAELVVAGCVQSYEFDSDPYLFLPKLAKHQRLEPAKAKSRLPDPPPIGVCRSEAHSEKTVAESAPIVAESEPIVAQQVAGGRLHVAGSREHGVRNEPASQPRADAQGLCDHLADRIQKNSSNNKRPYVTAKWRKQAEHLLDIDEHSLEEAHRLIDWCQDSSFWYPNIRSMDKFRQKYEQLLGQARAGNQPAPNAATARTAAGLEVLRRLESQSRGEITA